VSVPVDVAALEAEVGRFGPRALLVTTSPEGEPHVTSVLARLAGGELTVGAGRRSRANAAAHPAATLVWPVGPDPAYCLIVDGTAEERDGEVLALAPTAAVLHRLAGASEDLPSCVRLEEPAPADGVA
jgi:hypothetical protein